MATNGVASRQDEAKAVEPNEETQSGRPPAPEYILLEQWEAHGSGGPYFPENSASCEEQRDEKPFDGREIVARADAALDDVMREAIEAFGETLRKSLPWSSPDALPDHWEAPGSGDPNLPEEPSSREVQHDENQDINIIPLHSLFLACEKCGDLFTKQYNMEMHTRWKHWNSMEGIHNCTHCSYTSTRKVDIIRHERTHVDRRESVCHLCQKRFSRPDNLKLHMMIHSGDKPYECGQCSKRFRQRVHARRHEQVIHSRRYPLTCPRCGAGAEDVTKLRRHTCKPLGTTEGKEGFKRGRGRPRLMADGTAPKVRPRNTVEGTQLQVGVKRGRGRPRKVIAQDASAPAP
ncbi:uncharacterized protein LOC144106226 [Amblyomma americanum]